MPPSPISIPKMNRRSRSSQQKEFGISTPLLFGAFVALLLALFQWPRRWLISGAPLESFIILLGASKGYRILPIVPLWTLLSTLNLGYAIASTSWLLYAAFMATCYPAIFLTSLFQFSFVADLIRHQLRRILSQIQFVKDTIALFNIPALEIDTDVDGLMVIRGITFSLSTLTLVARGIEVGIKLSDDMELALQTEKVTVAFFRRIDIEPVYANIKGGAFEMTFGNLDINTEDAQGNALMVIDSALLKRAATTGDLSRPPMIKMKSKMTDGRELEDLSSAKEGLQQMTTVAPTPDNAAAQRNFEHSIKWIEKTNMIYQCRKEVLDMPGDSESFNDNPASLEKDIRAAISTRLHSKPSIPHPPRASIKVTTLKNLSSPRTKTFLHRLPLLLRLLLNPLSYFHPVYIEAIVAAGSGKWISSMLQQHVFQDYSSESSELRRLERRILSWLSDANFVLELDKITGLAQVPFLSHFDIVCYLDIDDVMAYRMTVGTEVHLSQVVRVGGADATFSIPTYLLPHHEHLLPPVPTEEDEQRIATEAAEADSKPKSVQKERVLEQTKKDETNVKISAHASLPASFDQELLNFVAALVKATKVVELEKEPDAMESEINGIKDLAKSLNRGMKDGMKKAMVDGIVNDKWIAKIVGKITTKLETVQGDIGYSGNIPVALAPYRLPEGHPEANKLLA